MLLDRSDQPHKLRYGFGSRQVTEAQSSFIVILCVIPCDSVAPWRIINPTVFIGLHLGEYHHRVSGLRGPGRPDLSWGIFAGVQHSTWPALSVSTRARGI